MAEVNVYRKPVMTNLPKELGISVFKQILNSTVPNREKMNAESQRLLKENLKIREKEIAQGNTAK